MKSMIQASQKAHGVVILPRKMTRVQSLGPTQWKRRTDPANCPLICTYVAWYLCTPPPQIGLILKIRKKFYEPSFIS